MKNSFTILVALFIVATTFAQAPEQMSYQAIVRNATGNLVTNQQVGMQISILQTTATGTAVYVETHTETTNANGLLTLQVGAGSVQNGTFASIDWSAGPYFVKAETDPAGGTTYTITGTQQLMSVPYALYAETSGASSSLWTQSGTDVVYTAGDAQINGLTVGRGAGNIASNTANGSRALFSNTFGIYNTATGNGALISNTEGDGNTANGTLALFSNTDGSNNTANGSRALFSNTTGSNNTAIGYAADVTSGSLVNATAIGFNAKVNADNKIQLGDINVTSVATSGALTTGTVTYPIVNGTVGQVLTTDGAGAATWSDAGATGPQGPAGNDGAAGATGAQGPIGNDGVDGQGGITNAGTGISVTGAGTGGSPYVVSTTSPCGLAIGQTYQGGIIFYLDPSGCHGLISHATDQSTGIAWWNGSYTDTYAFGSGLFNGDGNCYGIRASQGGCAFCYAAELCIGGNSGGYSDWYLPSKYELNLMYQNIGQGQGNPSLFNVGGFAYSYYWSSTEYDTFTAWEMNFGGGNMYHASKNATLYVRAVRAF
jgi:hypothetical protein